MEATLVEQVRRELADANSNGAAIQLLTLVKPALDKLAVSLFVAGNVRKATSAKKLVAMIGKIVG